MRSGEAQKTNEEEGLKTVEGSKEGTKKPEKTIKTEKKQTER